MSTSSLTFLSNNHNSKLYFSKYELNMILSCYSLGVSRGNWMDYSIYSNKNEAIFFIYKHTSSMPEYSLIKYRNKKENKYFYKLIAGEKNNNDKENIEELISILKRKNIKVIK